MASNFTHLHIHTQFSLLDGFCNIKKLVKKVKDLGMDSIAITDHGVMFGAIDFYKECVAQGIKPILGCEVYMAERTRFDKEYPLDKKNYHLILLAENNVGYSNLIKLVSIGYTEGFYRKPRIDFESLEQYHEGIICLTGCIAGKVPQKLINDDYEGAREDLRHFIRIFGKDNVFAEIQDHEIPEEKKSAELIIKLAREEGIGIVATNDSHYIEKEDAEYQDLLLCIQMATTVDDPKRMRFPNDSFYVKSEEEMRELFSYIPEAVSNTHKIAQRCNVNIEFHHYHLPRYDLPEGVTSKEYLHSLCMQGLEKKYPSVTDELMQRLDYELSVIDNMGFNDYFLIVWDFIKYAKDHDIAVGPGRGSAAGSLVSYTLNITEIDPIKYNLIFERFLNSERVSMPDIDVDFCYENRHKVIEYVVEKYGETNVAQICTFGTMGAKAVIRDVGRALGMSYSDCDRVAKEIPTRLGTTIDSAIEENSELQKMIDNNENIAKLIRICRQMEGCPRHASTHAAGVVITDIPIRDYVPLYVNDGNVATQYTMTTIEELGLLKMDFLGLRNLTVIKDTLKNIRHSHGIDIDIRKIDYTDQNVYSLISQGDTMGVFQLESSGMRSFMQHLRPDNFEDIIAGISLYRPGPMQYIDTYVENKRHPESIKYLHHTLEPILNVTYGCMVYQEQVMQIVRDLAGYSMGQSDNVRRAMSKKKIAVMNENRKIFVYGDESQGVIGCIKNGIDEEAANKIYDQMMDFASYAFNKSHAAAYAVVAYQTAFLKTYYPAEFMAALLTSIVGFEDKINKYIHHLSEKNIPLLIPDVNESFKNFTVVDGAVRFGLLAVKGLGESAVDEIIRTREEKGRYTDFGDFVKKLDFKHVNKRGVESLIKAGAFDSLGHKRSALMEIFSDYIDGVFRQRKQNVEGQMNFMDLLQDSNMTIELPLPKNREEFDMDTLLQYEKESMGLYISGHPLSKYDELLKTHTTHDSLRLNPGEDEEPLVDGEQVVVGGLCIGVKTIMTKSGKPMAFMQMEDLYGSYEVVVFSKSYDENIALIKKDEPLIIRGRISKKDDGMCSISASQFTSMRDSEGLARLKPINSTTKEKYHKRAKENLKKRENESEGRAQSTPKPEEKAPKMTKIPQNACVVVALEEYSVTLLPELKTVLKEHPGNVKVILYNKVNNKKYLADRSMWVSDDVSVLEPIRQIMGYDSVKLMTMNR